MLKRIKYAQVGRTLFSLDPLPQLLPGVVPIYNIKPSWQQRMRNIIESEKL